MELWASELYYKTKGVVEPAEKILLPECSSYLNSMVNQYSNIRRYMNLSPKTYIETPYTEVWATKDMKHFRAGLDGIDVHPANNSLHIPTVKITVTKTWTREVEEYSRGRIHKKIMEHLAYDICKFEENAFFNMLETVTYPELKRNRFGTDMIMGMAIEMNKSEKMLDTIIISPEDKYQYICAMREEGLGFGGVPFSDTESVQIWNSGKHLCIKIDTLPSLLDRLPEQEEVNVYGFATDAKDYLKMPIVKSVGVYFDNSEYLQKRENFGLIVEEHIGMACLNTKCIVAGRVLKENCGA